MIHMEDNGQDAIVNHFVGTAAASRLPYWRLSMLPVLQVSQYNPSTSVLYVRYGQGDAREMPRFARAWETRYLRTVINNRMLHGYGAIA